ncbi:MAG: hypothetical protein J6J36_03550 [Clostridia bacterium]|nr:hypothetical protein [Clostridia bacterium]
MFFRYVYIIGSMLIILLSALIFGSCQRYQCCSQLGQVFMNEREYKKNSVDEKVSCKGLIHKRAINIIEKNVGLVILFFIMGFYIKEYSLMLKIRDI